MKLTLPMIVNKFPGYMIDAHIKDDDINVAYKNARDYHCEGHLFIEEHDDGVYIYGRYPDSYIIIDCPMHLAMRDLMNIYDDYDEFEVLIRSYLKKNKWQDMVEYLFDVLKNPIFIITTQGRILAIAKDKVDPTELGNTEWEYYNEYGYASIRNTNRYKWLAEDIARSASRATKIVRNLQNPDHAALMLSLLIYNNKQFGRITVMEYYKQFSEGDKQIIEFVSLLIAEHLYDSSEESNTWSGNTIFATALKNKSIGEVDLNNMLSQYGWKRGEAYRVFVLDYRGGDTDSALKLMSDYCEIIFREHPLITIENRVAVLINESKEALTPLLENVKKSWLGNLHISIGVSLEFRDIENMYEYYLQGLYANTLHTSSDYQVNMFYNDAMDFILSLNNLNSKMKALHPDIKRMLRTDDQSGINKIETFYHYLLFERSPIRAADELRIHKNTLLYRVKEIKESLKYDLDDDYDRTYMFLSLLTVKANKSINLK